MITEQLKLEIDDVHAKANWNLDDQGFRQMVIDELFKKWLTKYAEQKFYSSTFQHPKLTSTLSDVPSGPSNQFRSVTEMAAIKSADAKRFIEIFHQKLQTLPADYRRIIEKKYLQVGTDGKWPSDEVVYPELCLSRSLYFELKPKALYWLGFALLAVEC